jgi:7-cyano-7-deazaguanine synthase in queuosine biosynthesis
MAEIFAYLPFNNDELILHEEDIDTLVTKSKLKQEPCNVSIFDNGKWETFNLNKIDAKFHKFINDNLKQNTILLSSQTLDKNQPYFYKDTALVFNGLISNESEQEYSIYDPSILQIAYINNDRDIKLAIESISGGWSFILYDEIKDKLYLGSSFVPIAHSYILGTGYVVHSSIRSINRLLLKHNKIENNLWNKFYKEELDEYSLYEIDCKTKQTNIIKYEHKFTHPVWKQKKHRTKRKFIVLSSSGIDSTATLAYLNSKYKGDVIAVYVKYNYNSENADYICLTKICSELNIPLKVIDLSNTFLSATNVSISNNIDLRNKISEKEKSTDAWIPNRNAMFINAIATMAESMIFSNEVDEIFITGGFPVVFEELYYPDCSNRFIDSINKTLRLSTLVGSSDRLKWINPLSELSKTELIALMKHFYPTIDLIGMTNSCDRSKVINGENHQCARNGIPACGTEVRISCMELGIEDTRKYYELDSSVIVDESDLIIGDIEQKDIQEVVKSALEKIVDIT